MVLYHFLVVKLWLIWIGIGHYTEPSNPLVNASSDIFHLDVVCKETATGWRQTKKKKKQKQQFDLEIIFSFLCILKNNNPQNILHCLGGK